MNLTPIIDMFSGTGELARAVSAGLEEPTRPMSSGSWDCPPSTAMSATHYFFVWLVESVIHVRADNHLLLKKRN